jgi:predicted NUDIX family phosphoesterase
MSEEELVLGLPRKRLPTALGWRGVRGMDLSPLLRAAAMHGEFRPRSEAETDSTWKQLIPYLLLRDGERIFLMRRTKAGGDERLHDRYSIGVGGHVNPQDGDVLGGLRREWAEEIEADFEPEFQPIGLLNDDENEVGAVHLGLVYAADAGGRPVEIREKHKLEGAFASAGDVAQVQDKLETWSALLFEFLQVDAQG